MRHIIGSDCGQGDETAEYVAHWSAVDCPRCIGAGATVTSVSRLHGVREDCWWQDPDWRDCGYVMPYRTLRARERFSPHDTEGGDGWTLDLPRCAPVPGGDLFLCAELP